MAKHKYFIYGSGGHATSLIGNLLFEGCNIQGVVDEHSELTNLFHLPISTSLPDNLMGGQFLVAIGDNFIRNKVMTKIIDQYGEDSLGTFISSKSYVSKGVTVGAGAVVMPRSYLGPKSELSMGVLINTGAIVEHDCFLSISSSLAPNSVLAGLVKLGSFTHIGLSSTVDAKVTLGSNCVLGANSFLMENLGDNSVAYGNPARFKRKRIDGENYLK